MIDATVMTRAERDKLTREIERLSGARKPVGLVSVIAEVHSNRPLTISEVNAIAAPRGISYGQMVIELERMK